MGCALLRDDSSTMNGAECTMASDAPEGESASFTAPCAGVAAPLATAPGATANDEAPSDTVTSAGESAFSSRAPSSAEGDEEVGVFSRNEGDRKEEEEEEEETVEKLCR